MRHHRLSVPSALAAVLLASPVMPLPSSRGDMLVKHKWDAIPDNWATLGHPPYGTTIDLFIALKPQHENALIDALIDVSEPSSPKYGAHLSREQVFELVAPHPEALELVSSWLQYQGVPPSSISTTHGGGWLTIAGVPVSQANELLGASYQLYYHSKTNSTIIRTVGYALPAALHTHVQTVAPTTAFASTRSLWQTPRSRSRGAAATHVNATSGGSLEVLSRRANYLSPSDLRSMYHTVTYVPAAADENKLGIVGFQNDYPSQVDLTAFMTKFRDDAIDATFSVVELNGVKNDPSKQSPEANIDTQYAGVMAYPTPQVFYSVGGNMEISPSGEPSIGDGYLEWLKYLTHEPSIPQTISISYGNSELTITREYATALCALFTQLGVRGTSVLASSGDFGVGEGDCKDKNKIVKFNTNFPASCPSVTSVGGTTIGSEPEVEREVAFELSGGGFSVHFPRPEYQDYAVPPFIKILGNKYDGLYNRNGRGVPDIAVQADNFAVFIGGKTFSVGGTSCSTPTAAGIISLLNDYLISQDKPTLGFLNLWLYGGGLGALKDIISGNNPGCNTDGFTATDGWDPVTGLGSLDFQIMLYLLDHHWPPSD